MNVAVLFQGMATLAWLAFIAVVLIVVIRASRNNPLHGGGKLVLIVVLVALVLSSLGASAVFINPEERGVVLSAISPQGYRSDVLQPGLRFIIPFAEQVVRYPISRQTYTMSIAPAEGAIKGDDSITARTSDGQQINVDASVIYQINPEKVVQVHIQWQDRYTDELVRAQSRGTIRDAVAQFNVEEVVTSKRQQMVDNISEQLTKKFNENGLTLVDFVLRNITFSPEYAASVEQKQIAEQQAQQAKFVVEQKRQEAEQARQVAQGQADAVVIRAKADAESRLISADAEAKSLNLIAEALKEKPELLTYQYITKLSPNIQTMLLPSNAPFIFPFPTTTSGTTLAPTPAPTAEPAPGPTPAK
jgi:regulator of protease activity HflC (stomatin/prohibitin superfamily)